MYTPIDFLITCKHQIKFANQPYQGRLEDIHRETLAHAAVTTGTKRKIFKGRWLEILPTLWPKLIWLREPFGFAVR